jgi:DNA-binding response OmpR family regulator
VTGEDDRESRETTEVPRGSETILLVEDDGPLREVVRETLEEAGYGVLEAFTAFAALELVHLHAGPIHLALVDVVIPGTSGRALTERIPELSPGARVLYMSGAPKEAWALHGVPASGIHVLAKPFTREQLLRRVREVLDARG